MSNLERGHAVIYRARRTSEHMALALFCGVILFFLNSFIVTEQAIPNEALRRVVQLVFAVIRLGVPVTAFAYMQKKAGFEVLVIEKRSECSVKYNITLAFAGFVAIFIFGMVYSVAFPMAASGFCDKSIGSAVITVSSSVIVPAVFEELLYRRLICRELTVHGSAFAVIISALLFGLAHFSFYTFPYAFVCGIILGFVYVKTGSVKYTLAIHFANNMLGYIFSVLSAHMDKLDYTNMMMLVVIALGVLLLGAFYALVPNKRKFAMCENGNVSSSVFLTFPMVVYLFCAVLMNFI